MSAASISPLWRAFLISFGLGALGGVAVAMTGRTMLLGVVAAGWLLGLLALIRAPRTSMGSAVPWAWGMRASVVLAAVAGLVAGPFVMMALLFTLFAPLTP